MVRPPALLFHALAGLGTLVGVSGAADPAVQTPHRAVSSVALSPRASSTEIVRADDGLFYVTGLVNGQSVRFVIDTGATVVTLTRADAERVGAVLDDSSFDASVNTANGSSAMAWSTLRQVKVAGREVGQVEVAVPQSGLPVSLLGQNVLSRLGRVTLDGNRLNIAGNESATADR